MEWDWNEMLENLDGVPQWAKALYKQGDDKKFHLLDEVKSKVDVSGLNSALDKERKARREHERQLKEYQRLGKLEEIQEKLDAAVEGGDKAGAAKWEKMKADMLRGHEEALKAKDSELAAMRGSLDTHLIDGEAASALAEAKGSTTLLLPHVRSQVKVFHEDGKYVARVVDKAGDPRGNGKGGYMGIRDLVAEMRKDQQFARAFEASGTSGSGKRPGSGGGTPSDQSSMNPTQKVAAGLATRTGQ